MPRPAVMRPPAEPTSKLQRIKYQRMLDAAASLGAVSDFDGVQMHDVAKQAGVAIGTLYRYFPSKTHLFVAVMAKEIDRLSENLMRDGSSVGPAPSPQDSVADALVRALRALQKRSMLANSMIRSANIASSRSVVRENRIEDRFGAVLYSAARLTDPTADDRTLMRLIYQQWFAITQACLDGHIAVEVAESDIGIACKLLLAPLSSAQRWRANAQN